MIVLVLDLAVCFAPVGLASVGFGRAVKVPRARGNVLPLIATELECKDTTVSPLTVIGGPPGVTVLLPTMVTPDAPRLIVTSAITVTAGFRPPPGIVGIAKSTARKVDGTASECQQSEKKATRTSVKL